MTTTIPSAALVPVAPVFTNTERLALAMSLVPPGNTPQGPSAWPAPATQMTPCSCSRSTEPHPRTANLAGVAVLADHLDLLPRQPLYS
jgi:hypothetical protein